MHYCHFSFRLEKAQDEAILYHASQKSTAQSTCLACNDENETKI